MALGYPLVFLGIAHGIAGRPEHFGAVHVVALILGAIFVAAELRFKWIERFLFD